MKVDKKLAMFEQIAMLEVEERRRQTQREMNEVFKSAVDEAVRTAEKNAKERIRAERYDVDKVNNKEIVNASVEAKRALITKREKLTDDLFADVAADVDAFVSSPAYEEYLTDAIHNALSANPSKYACVMLATRDMRYAARITSDTGLTVEEMNIPCLGGFKLLSSDRRAVADYTLDTRIMEERRQFSIISNQDMWHEVV